MEPRVGQGDLQAYLEKMMTQVDRVAGRHASPSFPLAWQLLIRTPLALAHTAWSRMWAVFVVFVVIAAVGQPGR